MEEQTFLYRALADGHLELSGGGKSERIRYVAVDHSERWSDPEEKIRAEFYAELIYRYQRADGKTETCAAFSWEQTDKPDELRKAEELKKQESACR